MNFSSSFVILLLSFIF